MDGLTLTQQRVLAFAPKPPAALSFFCSLFIFVEVLRSPTRRKKMYHRLMLMMSINNMLMSVWLFWGTWAIPEGTPFAYGASGTTQTCAAQGSLLQMGYTVPGYYSSLSLFFFLAVRNNFAEEKLVKIEPWIHLIVYMFPLSTAIIALKRHYFNPSGPWCWVTAYPPGCNKYEALKCIYGGDIWNYGVVLSAAMFVFLAFATFMIASLFWMIRQREKRHDRMVGMINYIEGARRQKSWVVAKQAALYLLAFYAVYFFAIVSRFIEWTTGSIHFPTLVVGIVFISMQGVFNMIVYVRPQLSRKKDAGEIAHQGVSLSLGYSRRRSRNSRLSSAVLVSAETVRRKEGGSSSGSTNGCLSSSSNDHGFSIFDGTNASDSPWARYLCDESDEEEDEGDGEQTQEHLAGPVSESTAAIESEEKCEKGDAF